MKNTDTILITGVAGLLGWNFATWLLLHTNHRVIGVDAMYNWGNHNEVTPNLRYEFHQLDLVKDYEELDRIVKENNVRVIYHFASYAAEGLSPFMRRFNYLQNTVASSNVINTCIKHDVELVFTSSISVYGGGAGHPFKETDWPRPVDPYGIAKAGIEQDLACATNYHGLKWVIIRPHNVFGKGQNVNDKYRNVIGIWMHQAIEGKPMTIYGNGEQRRAFTYIDNILEPMYKVLHDDHIFQVYNLGGIESHSINEICDMVKEVTGFNKVEYLQQRGEVFDTTPDPSKSIEKLGYKDKVDLLTGLHKMWDWVRLENKVGKWYEWDEFELDKGIYSYWK